MNSKKTLLPNFELPLKVVVSFEKVFLSLEKYAADSFKGHHLHKSAVYIVEYAKKHPEIINGFSDPSLLEKHKTAIDTLLAPLFPDLLLNNEIKAASIPFTFNSFKFTDRFKKILENAGEQYQFKVRNFDDDLMYIYACTLILGVIYKYPIDLKRPILFDIPDTKSGFTRYYRGVFNIDFFEIIPLANAPKISQADIKKLLDNFDNIDLWKSKFPPDSYQVKGFGIMNLFDVTPDEIISKIKDNLLKGDEKAQNIQHNLQEFYAIKDLQLGSSLFDTSREKVENIALEELESLFLDDGFTDNINFFFGKDIAHQLFVKANPVAIADVKSRVKSSNKTPLYRQLDKNEIGSILLIPINPDGENTTFVLEIASPRPFELNTINQQKLEDIIPAFKVALERGLKERNNIMEATIQQHYTAIHPTVKWRFYQAVEKYHKALSQGRDNAKLDQIVFKNVYPLYGQLDIKDSSISMNNAIRQDFITQLENSVAILRAGFKTEKLSVYKELIFRIEAYLKNLNKGLKSADEVTILDFLNRDIYPVFEHLKNQNANLASMVSQYESSIDKDSAMVCEKRKDYQESVMLLNEELSRFIDAKQTEIQMMFPHYFERYNTDGLEYNLYIGASLTDAKTFDPIYLKNLKLWQLQMMCAMENIAFTARKRMKYDLRVASLILLHSRPLSIRFRMDEKQFDVDGAYNIRYEIIKKRIDKAYIKGKTKERLTVPGKLAIVYTQEEDAREYLKYIKYLESKNMLGEVEKVELEDLQGVSGLKALRVSVIYKETFSDQKMITFKDLLEQIKV